jgi:hypothetical protein
MVGAKELTADLNRLARPGGAFDKAASDAANRVLTPRAATTRGSIPSVSGAMAASVNVKPEPFGAAISEGDGVVYAGWVDFGGSRPQSGPRDYLPQGRYLFPSVGDLTPPATAALDTGLQSAIDSFGWTYKGTP